MSLLLPAVIGAIVGMTSLFLHLTRKKRQKLSLVERVERLLPQTQCGQCGYPGCRPYALAMIQGAPITQCPPGGTRTLRALAKLLDRSLKPQELTQTQASRHEVAKVREADCIGCTKCIIACPVDAILGAPKKMHSVLATECNGCALCLPVCPVDCIDLRPTKPPKKSPSLYPATFIHPQAAQNKARFEARTQRLKHTLHAEKAARQHLIQKKSSIPGPERIETILARVRNKKRGSAQNALTPDQNTIKMRLQIIQKEIRKAQKKLQTLPQKEQKTLAQKILKLQKDSALLSGSKKLRHQP